MSVCVLVCVHVRVCVCKTARARARAKAHAYVCVCVSMCVCDYLIACVCASAKYPYTHTYTHVDNSTTSQELGPWVYTRKKKKIGVFTIQKQSDGGKRPILWKEQKWITHLRIHWWSGARGANRLSGMPNAHPLILRHTLPVLRYSDVWMCICVYVYMRVCLCVCVCVCVYVRTNVWVFWKCSKLANR